MKEFLIIALSILMLNCSSGEKIDLKQVEVKQEKTIIKEQDPIVKELMNVSENEKLVATVNTNVGSFEIELFADKAPKTVENFVGLITDGKYNGVIFHRVIADFMLQGGDPTGTGRGGESYWGGKFEDEFHDSLRHTKPGMLSMANAGPNTNGSQFFVTLVPTPWLDGKHAIFGEVVLGMDIVEAIGKTETGMMDKPVKDIVMETVTVEKRAK